MAFRQVKDKINQMMNEQNFSLTELQNKYPFISSLIENTNTNNGNTDGMDNDDEFTNHSDDDDDATVHEIATISLLTPQKVLKECTKILLEIENDKLDQDKQITNDEFEQILKKRHNAYCQRKQTKNEKALPLHEFVAACAITADQKSDKPFLFQKTKLSFTIMCSNCDASQDNHQ